MKSRTMILQLFVVLTLVVAHCVRAANPVTIPIIKGGLNVHSRPFAKLPDSDGDRALINAIVSRGSNLYVVTLTKIYRVTPSGGVSLYLDVAAAIRSNTGRSISTQNKQHGGVRGIAFHTQFNTNGLLYISAMEQRPSNPGSFKYISDVSDHIDADSVLLEFKHNQATGMPLPSSYRLVFRIGMPVYDHPIKQIAFRSNLLYIAHGDGSVQSASAGGGQKNDALGKILRIDPRKTGDKPYTIPSTNPFVNRPSMKSEVWALGFRNPHHICFSKGGTLFVADAGRANIEEVNVVLGGKNYGWSKREGTFVHVGGGLLTGGRSLPSDDAKNGFEYPVAQVGHEGSVGAEFVGQAIAGGCPVENGSPMSGNYFYADFPSSGKLYYSKLLEIRSAVTRGSPGQLKQARTRQAVIFHDGRRFETLGDAMRSEGAFSGESRVDVRFGRGSRGELYWSSKRSGRVYLFTSSLPGGPGGPT